MLEKALRLARIGVHVFPVRTGEGRKVPLTPAGHLDATTDETVIEHWFSERFKDAAVGVYAGASGLVFLDIDVDDEKGYDGFDSIGFEDIPDTVMYQTPRGGYHYIYLAPEGVKLQGNTDYRQMEHVDRRGGSSYAVWYSDEVPESRDEFTAAPEWLCDPARVRSAEAYEGDLMEWFKSLTPGEPSAAVRKSIARISEDMGHSEMVSAQHHAIRLGAEGHPGVPEYLEALEEAWLSRPGENHGTPEHEWPKKFAEALHRGVEEFGGYSKTLANLKPFNVLDLPAGISPTQVVGSSEASKAEWTKVLNTLVESGLDDNSILSIMWNAPRLRPLSMDWGIEFVQDTRLPDAKKSMTGPEPAHLPSPLSEEREEGADLPKIDLLTPEERERVSKEYTFTDIYMSTGRESGFVNEKLYRAAAWSVLSMAFGFKAFITPGDTDIMPVNLWFTTLAYSGTGKTRAAKFEETIMNVVHDKDNLEQRHSIGGNLSPQGLHIALLERNRQPTVLFEDEAAGFFKRLTGERWMESLAQDMSHFYEGQVGTINKVSQSHLKGKSGVTSFNVHLYSTPENFFKLITEEQFTSGFLARMNWILGDEPEYKPNSIDLPQSRDRSAGLDRLPPLIEELGALLRVARDSLPPGMPVHSTDKALRRQSDASNKIWDSIQGHAKFSVLEPAARRIAWETVRKTSVLMALSTGYREVRELHVLMALPFVEEWLLNLFRVAEQVDRSVFYRQSMEVVSFVATRRGGAATESAIYKQFASEVQRDPRELQAKIDLAVRSGLLIPETFAGGGLKYRVNK